MNWTYNVKIAILITSYHAYSQKTACTSREGACQGSNPSLVEEWDYGSQPWGYFMCSHSFGSVTLLSAKLFSSMTLLQLYGLVVNYKDFKSNCRPHLRRWICRRFYRSDCLEEIWSTVKFNQNRAPTSVRAGYLYGLDSLPRISRLSLGRNFYICT